MFILHFLHRFKHHQCSETLFFPFRQIVFFPQLCYFLMAWKFHSLPDARLPNVTFSKLEKTRSQPWINPDWHWAVAVGQWHELILLSSIPVWTERFLQPEILTPLFLLEMGAISQLQSPEWEVWGILMVWSECLFPSCRGFQLPPPPFISSDLLMTAFKAHKARISIDTSAGKCLFLPPWVSRTLEEPSNKMRAGSRPWKIPSQTAVARNALLYPGKHSRQEDSRTSQLLHRVDHAAPSGIAAPLQTTKWQQKKNCPKMHRNIHLKFWLRRRKEKWK